MVVVVVVVIVVVFWQITDELNVLTTSFYYPFHRLLRTGDVLSSQLAHVPPGDASVTAQPDFFRPLGVPALPHQHSELAHERPGLSLLCHQFAHGATFHGVTRDGLRPQRQPTGRATL